MVLNSLVLRPMLRRPSRFLMTVLGVAVGVASIVATFASSEAAISSLKSGVRQIAGEARVEVSAPGGVPVETLGALRPVARDAKILPVVEQFALVEELGGTVRVLGVDVLVDRGARDFDVVERTDAETSPTLSDIERFESMLRGAGCLITPSLAEALDLEPGDALPLLFRSRRVELEVAAVIEPTVMAAAWDRTILMDVAAAQERFGLGDRLDRVELAPYPGVDTAALIAAANAALPEGLEAREPAARGMETEKLVRSLRFNLTTLSGVSLLVGAMLVATTLATSVVQRRGTIALLRSIGASRGQIGGAIVAEAGIIGLIGGALGVAVGYLGAVAALASVRTTMAVVVQGVPQTEIALSPWVALIGVGLGLCASLAAAILPLIEAFGIPPMIHLRSEYPTLLSRRARRKALAIFAGFLALAFLVLLAPAVNGLPLFSLLGVGSLLVGLVVVQGPIIDAVSRVGRERFANWFGPPFRLAQAALSAGRRRIAWAAGSIGVTVALAISITTMVESFRHTVILWSEQGIRADLWIRPLTASTGVPIGTLDPAIIDVAQQVYGADSVDAFHVTEARHAGEPIALAGADMAVVKDHAGTPFMNGGSGEIFTRVWREDAAIVNEPFMNRYGLGVGDTVEIQVRDGVMRKPIVGVFYDYSAQQGLVIVDNRSFLRHYPDAGPSGIAVFKPELEDLEGARQEFLDALGGQYGVEVMLNRELREQVLVMFDRTFAITQALAIVSAAVAAIAVLTVLFTLAQERRFDISLMKTLGGSRRQIAGMIVWEAGLLGLIGSGGGLVFGLGAGWILVKVVNLQSFGWTLLFQPPYLQLVTTALLVIPACLLAGLAPALHAARANASEALREDA